MPRSAATADVFNAIAEPPRRAILDVLVGGEKAVGEIVTSLSMPQPQVSKHLRVLSEVGLVSSRPDGRRRLYSLEPRPLQPLQAWLAKYDRLGAYLKELQRQGEQQ